MHIQIRIIYSPIQSKKFGKVILDLNMKDDGLQLDALLFLSEQYLLGKKIV